MEKYFSDLYENLPRPSRAMPGPPAVWSLLNPKQRILKIDALQAQILKVNNRHFSLDEITKNELPETAIEELGDNDVITKPSAVLVPLIIDSKSNNVSSVLLMTRTMQVSHHKGQVSFPGGMVEKSDADVIQTALRETNEETGVDPQAFTIIGTTPVTHTRSRVGTITPVIGTCTHSIVNQFKPNPAEVASLHVIDIAQLVAPDNYMSEIWDYGEMSPTIHMFFVRDNQGDPVFIWGATAHILVDVLHCLADKVVS